MSERSRNTPPRESMRASSRQQQRKRGKKLRLTRVLIAAALGLLVIVLIGSCGSRLLGGGTKTQRESKVENVIQSESESARESESGRESESTRVDTMDETAKTARIAGAWNLGTEADQLIQENETFIKEAMKNQIARGGKNHSPSASAYAYSTKDVRDWTEKKVPYEGEKLVFLTFDDGPNHSITPKILDILKEEGVHATFFLIGNAVADGKYDDMVIRQYKEGHGIATHSFNHNYSQLYPGRVASPASILAQEQQITDQLKRVLGPGFGSTVFRYPGGHMSWKQTEASDVALADKGIHWIDWNAMTGDSEPASRRPNTPEAMHAFFMRQVDNAQTNVIVSLSHDAEGKSNTVASLRPIIRDLKAKGYKFGILE